MDYEKKYKDALEKAKSMIDDLRKGEDILAVSNLESMFPELAEQEDERIRKALIEHIKANCESDFILFQKFSSDDVIAWLEKQGKPFDDSIITRDDEMLQAISVGLTDVVEDLGWSDFGGIPIEDIQEWLDKQENSPILSNSSNIGKNEQVDGFDAELDALLMKYEHLSKKELQEPLEFYLGVVRDDLDIVREEKSKWTEEDECYMGECISAIATKDGWSFEEKRKTKQWLQSLKQRIEE